MSTNAHFATGLIGGATTDLDYIDGDTLNEGDFALVMSGASFYVYRLDATSGASESSPYIISPDSNAGTKRWIQQQVPWVSSTGEMFLRSNWIKDPQDMIWTIGSEAEIGPGYIYTRTPGYYNANVYALSGAGAWTTFAAAGDVGQVIADDTYATITNVTTGYGGVLTNLVLPGGTNASDTVTARITVDGTAYTISFDLDNASDRVIAGMIKHAVKQTDGGSDASSVWDTSGLTGGIAFRQEGLAGTSSVLALMATPSVSLAQTPCVRFESTLKVEMKSSDFTTTNNRDDCAAIYTLSQY